MENPWSFDVLRWKPWEILFLWQEFSFWVAIFKISHQPPMLPASSFKLLPFSGAPEVVVLRMMTLTPKTSGPLWGRPDNGNHTGGFWGGGFCIQNMFFFLRASKLRVERYAFQTHVVNKLECKINSGGGAWVSWVMDQGIKSCHSRHRRHETSRQRGFNLTTCFYLLQCLIYIFAILQVSKWNLNLQNNPMGCRRNSGKWVFLRYLHRFPMWTAIYVSVIKWHHQTQMGVSLNGGTPISHPKMIIFSRKTHGFVGETHHFRNPPNLVWKIPGSLASWGSGVLQALQWWVQLHHHNLQKLGVKCWGHSGDNDSMEIELCLTWRSFF